MAALGCAEAPLLARRPNRPRRMSSIAAEQPGHGDVVKADDKMDPDRAEKKDCSTPTRRADVWLDGLEYNSTRWRRKTGGRHELSAGRMPAEECLRSKAIVAIAPGRARANMDRTGGQGDTSEGAQDAKMATGSRSGCHLRGAGRQGRDRHAHRQAAARMRRSPTAPPRRRLARRPFSHVLRPFPCRRPFRMQPACSGWTAAAAVTRWSGQRAVAGEKGWSKRASRLAVPASNARAQMTRSWAGAQRRPSPDGPIEPTSRRIA